MINSALVSRVEKTIRLQRLFRPGDTLVVALSGGADSTALLDILSRLHGYHLRLIAAHLNHCLRGAESDADQEFCRTLAGQYAIPFEIRRIDIKKMAEDHRMNLEDAGRRARIEFFDDIRIKYGAAAVALAHHADDQSETVLMRLFRGSGMTGLSGMAPRNARGYVRPLLEISRVEIETYLRSHGLEWREDASNSDTNYLRNRIRHKLLPLLEEYNPAIRTALAATATIIGGDEALLAEVTEQEFCRSCRVEEGRVLFSCVHLGSINPALSRRVLRRALKQLTGTLEGIQKGHIESILEVAASKRPHSHVALPQGVAVLREYDTLIMTRTIYSSSVAVAEDELLIDGPGRYQLPLGGNITVVLTTMTEIPKENSTILLDCAVVPFPWYVRTFRPGDRMIPFGMRGRKKVKDIFIDKKIPRSERRQIPILLSNNNLLWVIGVCYSEACRITRQSATIVQVQWQAK
ncbi:MAG: tRNA lysidine(34) synthetase TilS [Desulfuromonadaceae bacterium]